MPHAGPRSWRRRSRFPRLAGTLFFCTLLLAACDAEPEPAADAAAAPPTEEAALEQEVAPQTPAQAAGPVSGLPPNELGQIMVLEYHRLGEPEGEWYRSIENFANDLQMLYERGYRPVTMRQVVEGDLDLPAGTTPVAFTIDDSSLRQFYYLEDGSIDPETMVGIWDAFQRENPEWANGAVWCVLPGADHPSNFWGEAPSREVPRQEREERIRRKVEYLVGNGHEICNHTMWHAQLSRYDDDFVQDQIGAGEDSIQAYLPDGYDIVTFALPLGLWPRNRPLAWSGTYRDGKSYEYEVVLEVSGGPNVSPFDTRFNGHSVNRLIVAPGALERQLQAYDRNPIQRYVSDGLPHTIAVPASLQDRVDRARWADREITIVEVERDHTSPEASAESPT